MSNLYIISDSERSKVNKYKVGVHTGNKTKLISRYITAIPEIQILYFEPHHDSFLAEQNIKNELKLHRVRTVNGKLSEWFCMDYSFLVNYLENLRITTIYRDPIGKRSGMKLRIVEQPNNSGKEFEGSEFNQKLHEFRVYIDKYYTYREGTYISRSDLESLYNSHITQEWKYPPRGLRQKEFTALMNAICVEKGLVYKRINVGFVYQGLFLTSKPSLPKIRQRFTEEQLKEHKKTSNVNYYTKNHEIILAKNKVHNLIKKAMTGDSSPFTGEDYTILRKHRLLRLRYNIEEHLLPWMSDRICFEPNIENVVYRFVDIPESIQLTRVAYEEWKLRTGQPSKEETELEERRVLREILRYY